MIISHKEQCELEYSEEWIPEWIAHVKLILIQRRTSDRAPLRSILEFRPLPILSCEIIHQSYSPTSMFMRDSQSAKRTGGDGAWTPKNLFLHVPFIKNIENVVRSQDKESQSNRHTDHCWSALLRVSEIDRDCDRRSVIDLTRSLMSRSDCSDLFVLIVLK